MTDTDNFPIPTGDHYVGSNPTDIEVVNKEWGAELIIRRGDDGYEYATKVMSLRAGHQVSMHWHSIKAESFVLIKGRMIVEILDPTSDKYTVLLEEPYSSITIKPNTPHTFYVPDDQVGDTVFIESSTRDRPDDNYRLTKSGPRK